jgi:3-oxoacyl-[acyl-carrier-protein] synthase II
MRLALSSSGLEAKDVQLVSAHATSTPTGDEIEARAILKVFEGCSPWVSAVKSNLGHCFSAAGAIETILGVMSLQEVSLFVLSPQSPPYSTWKRPKWRD